MKTGFQMALFAMGFFSAVALAEPDTFGLGTGRDGPLVVTEAGRVLNRYTQMTGPAAPGDGVLLVEGSEGFGAGDLVLVLQVTGLVPEPRPGASGPIVLSDDPVGRWELARLAAVGNGTLTLKGPLVHSYAARVTQVIRIPEYTDVHVQKGASLRAVPWNGGTGGVVAFLATGTVRNDGEISATGVGFQGGRYAPDASDPERCMGMAVAARPGARKGEGVAVTQYGPMKTGRESGSNGGGGGVCPMAGGGGGGNGGPGGRGGWSADLGEGSLDIGGQGGVKLVHSRFDRMSFGGGGGSGHGEDWSSPEGGAGGGVIFIRAFELSGRGSIAADGEAGGSANAGGGSGGGAGGDIHLRLVGPAECGGVSARGGAGGNAVGGFMGGGGPGGGGGGGRVFLLARSSSDCLASSEAGLAGSSPDMHEVRSSGPGRSAQPTMDALALHAGVVVRSQPGAGDFADPPTRPTVNEPSNNASINTDRGFSIAGTASGATTVDVSITENGLPHTKVSASVHSGSSWTLNIPAEGGPGIGFFSEGKNYVITVKAKKDGVESSPSEPVGFTVDLTAPENTSIDSNPPKDTNSTSARFTFSSTDPDVVRYECWLNEVSFNPCTSSGTMVTAKLGPNSFAVRAVDKAGNADASPAEYTWNVDQGKPDTRIDSNPPKETNSTSATFTFSSPDTDVVRYECWLNEVSFNPCTSSGTMVTAKPGSNSFAVRALDKAGNADDSPARYTWNVDTQKPDTRIDSNPPKETNATSARFTFSSSDTDVVGYECSLNGGSYETCDSGVTYTVGPGPNSFAVRALDKAGNADDSPATYSWTVDMDAPEVRIHSKPPLLSNSTEATFTFSSTDTDVVRFECSLDDGTSTLCPGETKSYSGLGQGSHSFSVQAIDKAGNSGSARYNWVVDSIPPVVRDLRPADGEMVSSQTPLISGKLDEPLSTVRIYIDGQLAGELLVDNSGSWSFRSPTHLANGPHTVSAEATDPAGNNGPRTATQTFTVDTEPPDTVILEGPPSTHNSRLAAFVFSSPSGVTEFECLLDDAPGYTACGAESLFSGLANGPHKLWVRAKDPAGNVDPEPSFHEWYVLVELPRSPEISEPADGAEVNTRTPAISGTAVANGSVTVYINDKKSGVALVDESGHWIFRPPEPLEDGVYSLTADATDVAGNTSEQRSQVRVFTVRYTEEEPLRSIGGGLNCAVSGTDASLSLLGLGGLFLLSTRRRHRR